MTFNRREWARNKAKAKTGLDAYRKLNSIHTQVNSFHDLNEAIYTASMKCNNGLAHLIGVFELESLGEGVYRMTFTADLLPAQSYKPKDDDIPF